MNGQEQLLLCHAEGFTAHLLFFYVKRFTGHLVVEPELPIPHGVELQ